MASSGSVFSETLQSITESKLVELSKKRKIFELQRLAVVTATKAAPDPQAELRALLDGVKRCFSLRTDRNGRIISGMAQNARLELNLRNIESFLGQARYDPSVSPKVIDDWKSILTQILDTQSAKYEYASLFAQLINEWLSTEKASGTTSTVASELSEDFEELASKARLESRVAWEQAVFEPFDTSHDNIHKYLKTLFGNNDRDSQATKAVINLRASVEAFEIELAAPDPFNIHVLQWTIKGLLASDLLTNEKREVLKDFNGNTVILTEIADVLNMRMAELDTWSWGETVPIEQRKQVNGNYQIYMHEDLLQAIFLQYIGVKWSVFFKSAFKAFSHFDGAWASLRTEIPNIDKKRREYFLGAQSRAGSVQSKRKSIYRAKYFMTQLLDYVDQEVEVAEGDEEADYEQAGLTVQQPPRHKRTMQTARKSTGGSLIRKPVVSQAARMMPSLGGCSLEKEDESEEEEEDEGPKNPMQLKQSLLHLLSTEILISRHLHGEITCFHAEFDLWNPSLPHSTIRAVLSFLGVSERWLAFFWKFMEAPLAFPGEEPRFRRRGVPASHSLSEVLGETILFFMDFAVNQSTEGQQLWRMHDDFYFWSPQHQTCVKAWNSITKFADVMGVKINERKAGTVRILNRNEAAKDGQGARIVPKMASGVSTNIDKSLPVGQIRWGFLFLDPHSGRFTIDRNMVDSHIDELQTQLSDKTSIFAWIQAWNIYANTFFTTNFGKPAYCYGQAHVDDILSTLQRIQQKVFAEEGFASVVESLKARMQHRFDIIDVPDGYIFFPTELGGLEVMSPFISVLPIRDVVPRNPENLLNDFDTSEREAYRKAKQRFEKGQVHRHDLDSPDWKPKDFDTFMSFEEFVKYREEFEGELRSVLETLMKRPSEQSIEASADVMTALNQLQQSIQGRTTVQVGISGNWYAMTSYWKWVTQLYGPGIIEKFGGLGIVDPGLLPIGMVSLFRSGRVAWKG